MAFYRCVPTSVKHIPKPIYGDFVFNAGWLAGDGLITEKGFYYGGNGEVSVDGDGSAYVSAKDEGYAMIFPQKLNGGHQLICVTIEVMRTSTNGVRILTCMVVGTGENTIGNQITINGGYLNILNYGHKLNTITKTVPFTYKERHTIAVGIDYGKNDNRVYLDGRLVGQIDNAKLSNNYSGNCWVGVQVGEFRIYEITHFI